MKTSNILILIAVVVMVGVGLAAYGHYYFKRQADWTRCKERLPGSIPAFDMKR
jgi:hypothetical protein